MKYNTRPIDYTGCDQVIAEHLKRGEAIECLVWDGQLEGKAVGFVAGYCASNKYPYRCDEAGVSAWTYAEPILRKVTRIMPPERIKDGQCWECWFTDDADEEDCDDDDRSV